MASSAAGQDVASKIYASSQDSVFLVYLNDSRGVPSALGSAFLVAPHTLITNAHVVEAGDPVLAVGPVRIPLKVVRLDRKNDLAVLYVAANLTSRPLTLAIGKASPGEQIFAIGNPEGLEKTISQGIVSGLRTQAGRDLIQITSPISHGSSGGPILDSKGEVVAVAVAVLDEGQNLNFAVPVSYVAALLKQSENVAENLAPDSAAMIAEATGLLKARQQGSYSDDPTSPYQQQTQKIIALMGDAVAASAKDNELTSLACLGTKAADLSDRGISAARKLSQIRPSPESRALLAYVLYDRAEDEDLQLAFSKKGSSEAALASKAKSDYLSEAGRVAMEASREARPQTALIADWVLGSVRKDNGEPLGAIPLHTLVANARVSFCDSDLTQQAFRDLVSENDLAKKPDEAERWFQRYSTIYSPSAYEWDSEGDRRTSAGDFNASVRAYEMAADSDPGYGYDYCYAATESFASLKKSEDRVLADGRKCVDASTKHIDKGDEHHFTSELPIVYRAMASVLESRGVYTQALAYAKESLGAKPDDPRSLDTEADILADLERFSECIAAEQAAISGSDGKFPWMNFRLGYCYAKTENWSKAETSFRLAAEADKSDVVSAYNLGLVLSREGYTNDARQWFQEALRRKPDDALRASILGAMK
jgi:tetratricopeptide (TPR) repeat protein